MKLLIQLYMKLPRSRTHIYHSKLYNLYKYMCAHCRFHMPIHMLIDSFYRVQSLLILYVR